MPREWDFWTRIKLDVLRDYLKVFATASKSVPERVYLDAFAGEGVGVDRYSGDAFPGSSRIALATQPPFTRVRLFERPQRAAALEADMRTDFPDRDLKVTGGDCNVTIPAALAELAHIDWAPLFAFLDPDGMELAWETVAAIARHRKVRSGRKAELWMLFSRGLPRTLPVKGEKSPSKEDIERATRLFGTREWLGIFLARANEAIETDAATWLYLNLMRWRLQHVLGYRWTHPLALRNSRNTVVYDMIFATDHPVGDDVMRSLYSKAQVEIPRRILELREQREGRAALFDTAEYVVGSPYEYREPLDFTDFYREWM